MGTCCYDPLLSPLSLSLCRIMNKYQWMIGRNLDTVDKKVTCYCVVILSICLFVFVFVFVRFSSIYGAFHSKQTSNAGGFCVHVVSQLVV